MGNLKHPTIGFGDVLADCWPLFVDCRKRLLTEAPFLLSILNEYRDGTLLDAALGMGCESLFLLEKGFNVLSNERDDDLRAIAIHSANEIGIELNLTDHDWRSMSQTLGTDSVNSILLLGNSLCLLEEMVDIQQSLSEFFTMIRPGGCLVIDERNFPYILSESSSILNGKFRYSGEYIYCGTRVTGRPIEINLDRVQFGYFSGERVIGTLSMHPFRSGELKRLLQMSGFDDVVTFSDFQNRFNAEADYFTHVAYKK